MERDVINNLFTVMAEKIDRRLPLTVLLQCTRFSFTVSESDGGTPLATKNSMQFIRGSRVKIQHPLRNKEVFRGSQMK